MPKAKKADKVSVDKDTNKKKPVKKVVKKTKIQKKIEKIGDDANRSLSKYLKKLVNMNLLILKEKSNLL